MRRGTGQESILVAHILEYYGAVILRMNVFLHIGNGCAWGLPCGFGVLLGLQI
jgi:hypothetical protein